MSSKTYGKIFLILIGGLIVLMTAAVVGIQFFLGTGMAGRVILSRINKAIPGKIHWQGQRVLLFEGRLTITGLIIKDPDEVRVVRAAHVTVDIGIPELLSGVIFVEKARLDEPGVFLETDSRGRLNLLNAFVPPSGKPLAEPGSRPKEEAPANLRVDELIVSNGAFSFKRPGTTPETGAKPGRQSGPDVIVLDAVGVTARQINLARKAGRINLTIGSGHMDMAGIHMPLQKCHLIAHLTEGRIDPLELDIQTPRSRMKLTGSVGAVFDKPRLDLLLSLSTRLSDIRGMLNLDTELKGPLRLEARARGAVENPDVTAKLDYGPGRIAGVGLNSADFACRMRNREVEITQMDAELDYGSFESTGTVNLGKAFPQGFLAPPDAAETISYAWDIKGSGSRLRIEGLYDMAGHGIKAQARGRAKLEAISETFLAEGLAGSVEFQTQLSGPVKWPVLNVRLSGQRLFYRGFTIGCLQADAGVKNGELEIRSAVLSNQDSHLGFSGTMRLIDQNSRQMASDPDLNLTVAPSRLYLQDFLPDLLPDMAGRVDLSGHLSGSLFDMEGAFTVDGRDLKTGFQSIPAMHLACRIKGDRVYLEPLRVSLSPEPEARPENRPETQTDSQSDFLPDRACQAVRMQGWIGLDRRYNLRLSSDSLDFSVVRALADTGLKGRFEIAASGSGNLADPRAEGTVELSGLAVGDMALPEMQITARLRNHILYAGSEAPASMNLRYGLVSRDFRINAQLSETELAPYFKLLGLGNLSGPVSANLKADGNAENLTGIKGELNISSLAVRADDTELMHISDLTGVFGEDGITLSENRIQLLKKGYLIVSGRADWTGHKPASDDPAGGDETGKIKFTAKGSIPADIAGGLVPGICEPAGTFELEARLAGTIFQPSVSMDIRLQDLGLTVAETLQKLHDVNGHIQVNNQAVIISSLTGHLDGGKFSLDGGIELDRFMPGRMNVRLSAHAVPVVITDRLEALINADLDFSGTPSVSRLSGDLVLLEGRYFKDFNLNLLDKASEIGRRKRGTEPLGPEQGLDIPYLKQLSLDFSLSSRQPFVIDNNLALIEIRPELGIQGTLNAPLVTGRAEVRDGGILSYRDTEFKVKKGVVDFVNPYRIEPSVDIKAQASVRQWLITLLVSGPPEDLNFRLSSDPPESDADILSLLAVGKTTGELGAGSGGSSRAPEEMLANLVADKVEGQVKAETGLDIVEFEYRKNEEGAESAEEIRVTVGKELSRRLTVKYGMERKSGIVVQQSTAIYKLSENLAVNAYQDTEGEFGGEMRYRLEFR